MCKQIGSKQITRLIESVTEHDLENMPQAIKDRGWYDPLRILCNDGFVANPDCPMMMWYDDGVLIHSDVNKKVLIHDESNLKIYGVIGDIFKNSECEVTALF